MPGKCWSGRCAQCLFVVWLTCTTAVAAVDAPQEKAANSPSPPLEARIAQLIEQLGDPQYYARERAQQELRRLGAVAFDALLAAQEHLDIEIAMRARYLVRSLPIAWTRESDPPILKQLFKDYSERDRAERRTRAQHFSTLDDDVGIPALCRIMRFDPDRILSKSAAVLVLQSSWPDQAAARQRRATRIREEIALCKRPGAQWLRLYGRTLESPSESIEDWDKAVRAESELLAVQPQQTDHELVRDLTRWQTELLLREGRTDEALASVRSSFDLLGDDRRELYELLDWSVERGLHRIADELAERFAARFQDDPQLLYRLAESQLKRGNRDAALATADRARQLFPNNLQQHIEVAFALQRRLLPDWAESEFRFVVERTKPEDSLGARIRWALSEMLFDWGRELPAAEMAKVLVDTGNQNPQVFEFVDKEPGEVLAYMHYYYGMHYARLGDRGKQIEHFREAIQNHKKNPDFVIAMYRVPDPDDAWKNDVQQRMDALTGGLRKDIATYEGMLQRPMSDDDRQRYGEELASKLNELAWLISNTEGDRQEALAASLRSLELVPDYSAFLDTLGRCYYALGDYENAVRVQSRAVKQTPSMFVMRRQLELFEKALADFKAQQKKVP